MAFREMGMVEIREIVRWWLAGDGELAEIEASLPLECSPFRLHIVGT
jgi:hypothetical protein